MGNLSTAGLTDIGCKRKLNEDNFAIDNNLGLLLVADGMGGHEAGEIASRNAVEAIQACLQSHVEEFERDSNTGSKVTQSDEPTMDDLPNPVLTIVESAVRQANLQIYRENKVNGHAENQGMGTTIVGLWVLQHLDEAAIFHVGDSRLYLFRKRQLAQMTRDHSVHQLWLDSGKFGIEPNHNLILSALGLVENVNIDLRLLSLQKDDLILLCSDGLTSMVSDKEIEKVLAQAETDQLDEICCKLKDMANDQGGKDNITVILARYK